jgi:hypothetical protein
MENNDKKLKKLLAKLDAPTIDEDDLKSLCLAIISDIDGDTANHARVKIEALRLLKDVVVKETKANTDMGNSDIMSILNSKKDDKKKQKYD